MSFPRDAIQALYVSGNGENAVLREKLQETLGIPVYGLDPFAKEERVQVDAANRAGFTGAVGLLDLWSINQTTPVNFVKPRESKPAASPNRRRIMVGAAAAVLAIAAVVYGAYWIIGDREAELAQFRADKKKIDDQLTGFAPEIKYLEALKPWRNSAIPWLDELYDLAARAPIDKDHKGFRIKKLDMTALEVKKAASTSVAGKVGKEFVPTARITFTGVVDTSNLKGEDTKSPWVQDLLHKINGDKHCRAVIVYQKKGTSGVTEFSIEVFLNFQPPNQYLARLIVDPSRIPHIDTDDDDLDK